MSWSPKLVADWIAYQRLWPKSPDVEEIAYAYDAVWKLTRERPDDALEFVLKVLGADQSNDILQNLSAGPLEDLLAYHGESVIDRVERLAREHPAFASLLGGVWQNAMTDDVWARVQAVRNMSGCNGDPPTT